VKTVADCLRGRHAAADTDGVPRLSNFGTSLALAEYRRGARFAVPLDSVHAEHSPKAASYRGIVR
jgi:hypothetical protein